MRQATVVLEPDWGLDFGKPPQFEIRMIQEQDGALFVLGVAHSSIKVGDRFHTLQQVPAQQIPDEHHGNALTTVHLRVKSITAFHNALNRANAGMTVALVLTGEWSTLPAVLQAEGWTYAAGQYHQWADAVEMMPKLLLSR